MSNTSMLEQAFIDAESLKETALKNAETIILEKYSNEVKKAVENLLEEEVADETTEEVVEEEFEQIPNAHYQEEELGEDQEIDIDLDKLAEEL